MVQHSGMELVDMGLTRSQLKSIVKECIVEILAEGMGNSVAVAINEVKTKSAQIKQTPQAAGLRQNNLKVRTQSNALREAIRLEAGGNDVMASILADTAEKTLPAMLENDRMKAPMPSGKIETLVASHDPEELFGEETTSKWADLAFSGMQNK